MAHVYPFISYLTVPYMALYLKGAKMKYPDYSKLRDILINNINHLIYSNKWSLKNLSEKSNVPYETLKKLMNGKINNPSLISIAKIANAFDCSVDYLITNQSEAPETIEPAPVKPYYETILPKRSITFIKEIVDFELELSKKNSNAGSYLIPVLVPTGHMKDGMLFDSTYTENVDISDYDDDIKKLIMCGIKITNKSLHPTYLEGDILLVSKDRHPAYGETGIFLHDNCVYIRKYLYGTPSILMPVNGVGEDIIANDLSEWHVFGRVLTTLRSKDF